MKNDQEKIVDFLLYSEKLKTELRHASKNDGNRESAAEHSWRLTLFVMLVEPKLKNKIDLLKALKIATIHDIVEIDAKDIPVLEQIDNSNMKNLKDEQEKIAIKKVHRMLGENGDEIYKLWYEYLNQESYEAKVVRALDKIEGQMQFLSEDVKRFSHKEQKSVAKLIELTKELCKVDPYLVKLYESCGEMFRERTKPEK